MPRATAEAGGTGVPPVGLSGGRSGMGILPMSEGSTQTHGQDARATAGVQMLAVSRNAKLQGAPIRQTSSRFHDERTYWVA